MKHASHQTCPNWTTAGCACGHNLVVTREDGIAVPDQQMGAELFKAQCRISALEGELAALRHGNARYVQIAAGQANELGTCQQQLKEAQEQLAYPDESDVVIMEAMHELGANEGESILGLAYRKAAEIKSANEHLARYTEAAKELPEEPKVLDSLEALGAIHATPLVQKHDYDKLRDHATAQAARVKELEAGAKELQESFEAAAMTAIKHKKRAETAEQDAAIAMQANSNYRRENDIAVADKEKAEAERDAAVRDANRWRYWRSVWFDIGVNYKKYRAIINAGDIATVENEVDAAIKAEG